MNKNYICVFDFETDGLNPKTCWPVQLAAIIIDPVTLEYVPNGTFNCRMCPPDIEDENYFEKNKGTIIWHTKISGKSVSEILKTWKESPPLKISWNKFIDFLDKYHVDNTIRKSKFSAPIAAGANIRNFDLIIAHRLCEMCGKVNQDGSMKIFNARDAIDIKDLCFINFEGLRDSPTAHNMDVLREYFKISTKDAHDAFKDVQDESDLIIRFLKRQRKMAQNTLWPWQKK